jgi:4-amino-4-deoxy-L-arabinose transferase-like glycosyltransferase
MIPSVPARAQETSLTLPGHRVVLGAFLLVGVLLRLLYLGDYPLPMHQDELSNAYDGYCIAETGADRFGSRFPFIVRGFGNLDYRPALQAWLGAASVRVLGFSVTAGRLPSALLGALALVLLWRYVETLAGRAAALAAVALGALSPWHVLYSRIAHEGTSLPPFFVIAGLLLWQRALLRRYGAHSLAALGFCLGLATNTYQATKLVAFGLFVVVALDAAWTTWRRTHSISRLLTPVAVLAGTALLGALPQVWVMLTDPTHFFSRATDRVLWHRPEGGFVLSYLGNLAANLSPRYLFLSFGEYNFLSIARGLPVELVFFYAGLLGSWFALRRTRRRSLAHLVVALVLCSLPAALTENEPHALRASATSILLPVLSALGVVVVGRLLLWAVGRVSGSGALRRAVGGVYLAGVLVATAAVGGRLAATYVGSEEMRDIQQQHVLVKLGERLGAHQADFAGVVVEPFGIQAYLYIAAFAGITPAELQSMDKVILPETWDRCTSMGKYRFADPLAAWHDWRRAGRPRWLVASRWGRPEMTRPVEEFEWLGERIYLSEYDPGWVPLVRADRGTVLLSTLEPTAVEFGFAPPKTDRAWDDLPLVMAGVQYARGIGMHAPCTMSYAVPPGAREFRSLVGVSDGVRQCGRADVVFELRDQDGRVLASTEPLTPNRPPRELTIPLAGVTTLTLVAGEGRNGRDCDHADWVNAAFVLAMPDAP